MVALHHGAIVVESVSLRVFPFRQPPSDLLPLALAGKALQDHKPRLGRVARTRMAARDLPETVPQRLLRNEQFIRRSRALRDCQEDDNTRNGNLHFLKLSCSIADFTAAKRNGL